MLIKQNQFTILKSIDKDQNYTQRQLAKEMGISLGKVNYCLKSLINKGFIKAQNFKNSGNKIQYAYILTPSGMEEKAKLTIDFLKRKTQEYDKLKFEIEQLKEEVQKI